MLRQVQIADITRSVSEAQLACLAGTPVDKSNPNNIYSVVVAEGGNLTYTFVLSNADADLAQQRVVVWAWDYQYAQVGEWEENAKGDSWTCEFRWYKNKRDKTSWDSSSPKWRVILTQGI